MWAGRRTLGLGPGPSVAGSRPWARPDRQETDAQIASRKQTLCKNHEILTNIYDIFEICHV